ncbi:hypothetical protein F4859DRAFT_424687 [Xylaria cf. heliscus]|nr:hypothetical protein F4859DRAFT_424687 [Xylaria cf. heliscus]
MKMTHRTRVAMLGDGGVSSERSDLGVSQERRKQRQLGGGGCVVPPGPLWRFFCCTCHPSIHLSIYLSSTSRVHLYYLSYIRPTKPAERRESHKCHILRHLSGITLGVSCCSMHTWEFPFSGRDRFLLRPIPDTKGEGREKIFPSPQGLSLSFSSGAFVRELLIYTTIYRRSDWRRLDSPDVTSLEGISSRPPRHVASRRGGDV